MLCPDLVFMLILQIKCSYVHLVNASFFPDWEQPCRFEEVSRSLNVISEAPNASRDIPARHDYKPQRSLHLNGYINLMALT